VRHMQVKKQQLVNMLKRTQRYQNVGGRSVPQVSGCQLAVDGTQAYTLSLVRDGKTSLSNFAVELDSEQNINANPIPVPDIDVFLGVLANHGSTVSITHDAANNKILVKSGKKQTTLVASLNGLVFPHSSDTITEWSKKSNDLSKKFHWTLFNEGDPVFIGYQMSNGDRLEPFIRMAIDANELHEALRADNINGQRLNRYKFTFDEKGLTVGVGEEMKGFTTTLFDGSGVPQIPQSTDDKESHFEWSYEGGLENVLANVNGDAILYFLDFREYGQGISMVIKLPAGMGWCYQAGILA